MYRTSPDSIERKLTHPSLWKPVYCIRDVHSSLPMLNRFVEHLVAASYTKLYDPRNRNSDSKKKNPFAQLRVLPTSSPRSPHDTNITTTHQTAIDMPASSTPQYKVSVPSVVSRHSRTSRDDLRCPLVRTSDRQYNSSTSALPPSSLILSSSHVDDRVTVLLGSLYADLPTALQRRSELHKIFLLSSLD
jgi:hypothetical protein